MNVTKPSASTTDTTSGWPTSRPSQLGSASVVATGVNSSPRPAMIGRPAATMRSCVHRIRPSTSRPPAKIRPNSTVVAPERTGSGIATSSASKYPKPPRMTRMSPVVKVTQREATRVTFRMPTLAG
jgi:hypothetical protein